MSGGTKRGVYCAVSDFLKALPESIVEWITGKLTALGTDEFGRSDT